MVVYIIIPIVIVAIAGIGGYLVFHFLIKDYLCNRSVNATIFGMAKNPTMGWKITFGSW